MRRAQAVGGDEVLILPRRAAGVRAERVGHALHAQHSHVGAGPFQLRVYCCHRGGQGRLLVGAIIEVLAIGAYIAAAPSRLHNQLARYQLPGSVHALIGPASFGPRNFLQRPNVVVRDGASRMHRSLQHILNCLCIRVALQALICGAIVRDEQCYLPLGAWVVTNSLRRWFLFI